MLFDFISKFSGSVNKKAEDGFQFLFQSLTKSYKTGDAPYINEVRSLESFLEKFDYTPQKRKRKLTATLNNLEKARNRYKDLYTNNFINNYFIFSNAHFLRLAYAMPSLTVFIVEAAAIWILDELYYKDELEEIYDYLPETDFGHMLKIVPWISHPLYNLDLIYSTVNLILNKDLKEYKQLDKNEISLISDNIFLNKNFDCKPKKDFEAVLDLIDKESIDKAVKKYEDKVWEFYDIAFSVISSFDKEMEKIENEIERLKDNNTQTFNKSPLEMPNLINPDILPKNGLLDFKNNKKISKLIELENKLDNLKKDDIIGQICASQLRQRVINIYSDIIPKKTRNQLINFSVEDPFEMSFALIYLLNKNSDIPWLYYGSIAVATTVIDQLPFDTEFRKINLDRKRLNNFNKKLYQFDFDIPDYRDYSNVGDIFENREKSANFGQILYYNSYSLYPRVGFDIPDIEENIEKICENNELDVKDLMRFLLYLLKERDFPYMDLYAYTLLKERDEEDEQKDLDLTKENEDLSELKKIYTEIKIQKKNLQKALGEEKFKNNQLENQIKDLTDKNNKQKTELTDLRELIFNLQNDNQKDISDEIKNISFPYYFKKRIISFGGHQNWVSEMKKLLPDVIFYDANTTPNTAILREIDEIWLQVNYISHSSYYKIINNVNKTKTQIHYFLSTGVKKCAEQMVEENEKDI